MSWNLSQISRQVISRSANSLSEREQLIWSAKTGSVGNTGLLPRAKMLLVPKFEYFFLTGRLCSGGVYILTEQTMWFLPLVSCWEVVTRILIFCGYSFLSVRHDWWFSLWCKSIFFYLFWNVKFFIVAKQRFQVVLIFSKVPPWSE